MRGVQRILSVALSASDFDLLWRGGRCTSIGGIFFVMNWLMARNRETSRAARTAHYVLDSTRQPPRRFDSAHGRRARGSLQRPLIGVRQDPGANQPRCVTFFGHLIFGSHVERRAPGAWTHGACPESGSLRRASDDLCHACVGSRTIWKSKGLRLSQPCENG